MPDAGVLATILLIVGLFLLALELMIPSFGMIGILSAITLLISAWCAWQAWWGTSPGFFWTYAAFWLLGIPSALGGALFILQNTSLGDRLVLRGPELPEDERKSQQRPLEALIGQIGVAKSLLTPGGMVHIGNTRHHAESPGMVVEPETPVKVIAVKGNRLVVRIYDESAVKSEVAASQPKTSDGQSDPLADTVAAVDLAESSPEFTANAESSDTLDFDIPQD